MADKNDAALQEHLMKLLTEAQAHATFDEAMKGLDPELYGKVPEGAEHSPWQLLEHLRIAQWDILEFSRDRNHVSPQWPEGYWPTDPQPPDAEAWDASIAQFKKDLEAMRSLIRDPNSDLFSRIPHGEGQTLLREALVLADHNSYHLGQLVLLRKLLGSWPE